MPLPLPSIPSMAMSEPRFIFMRDPDQVGVNGKLSVSAERGADKPGTPRGSAAHATIEVSP